MRRSSESTPARWRHSLAASIASYDYRQDTEVPKVDISSCGMGFTYFFY